MNDWMMELTDLTMLLYRYLNDIDKAENNKVSNRLIFRIGAICIWGNSGIRNLLEKN